MWRFVGSSWSADNGGLSRHGVDPRRRAQVGRDALRLDRHGSLRARSRAAGRPRPGAPSLVQALGGDASDALRGARDRDLRRDARRSLPAAWRERRLRREHGVRLVARHGRRNGVRGGRHARESCAGRTAAGSRRTPGFRRAPTSRVVRFGCGCRGSTRAPRATGSSRATASPSAKYVPVVLDVTGATGARFRSELTIGNRSDAPVTVTSASCRARTSVSRRRTARLRRCPRAALGAARAGRARSSSADLGLAIPPGARQRAPSDRGRPRRFRGRDRRVYAFSRTYTADAAGSYGSFLDAPSDLDAAEDEGAIYGLRSVAGTSRARISRSRTSRAAATGPDHALRPGLRPDRRGRRARRSSSTLAPGEWKQLNGVLLLAGLPDGRVRLREDHARRPASARGRPTAS